MEDNFIFKVWKLVVVSVTIILMGVTSCNIHNTYQIGKAIENGAVPVEARMAFTTQASQSERIVNLLTR